MAGSYNSGLDLLATVVETADKKLNEGSGGIITATSAIDTVRLRRHQLLMPHYASLRHLLSRVMCSNHLASLC